MKEWNVTARFPELPASRYIFCATVKASDMAMAAQRGLRIIKRKEGVKRKRYTICKLDIQEVPHVDSDSVVNAKRVPDTASNRSNSNDDGEE